MKFRIFWDMLPSSQVDVDRRFRGAYCLHHQGALMIEAVRTTETSVNIYSTTRQHIPEDSKLHYNFASNSSIDKLLET
jgi:DNA topoisomerase VI subunit B